LFSITRQSNRALKDAYEMKAAVRILGACALVAVSLATPLTAKAGCATGAAAGGVVGHVAGHHAVAGAAVGCAIGHHEANKAKKAQAAQPAPAPSGNQPATQAPH
jgi:hypothetical protein